MIKFVDFSILTMNLKIKFLLHIALRYYLLNHRDYIWARNMPSSRQQQQQQQQIKYINQYCIDLHFQNVANNYANIS